MLSGLDKLFPQKQPIHMEIGCGKGKFACDMSKKYPNVNFIAMEKVPDVCCIALEKAMAQKDERESDNIRFIIGDAKTLAGFITTHYSSRYLNGSVYIINLNVRRSARRKGIATALLSHICQHYYPRHSKRMVSLDVGKSNVKALALYKKLGFRETDIPSQNGKTDVVMAIPLADLLQNTHTPRA